VHRTPGEVEIRNLFIEEADEQTHQPALGLSLFAQEEQIMPGDQADVDLRNDRVVVADDPREELFAAAQHAQEVVVDFAFDRFRFPAALAQFPQSDRLGSDRRHQFGAPSP
jgi:hypothetical protein